MQLSEREPFLERFVSKVVYEDEQRVSPRKSTLCAGGNGLDSIADSYGGGGCEFDLLISCEDQQQLVLPLKETSVRDQLRYMDRLSQLSQSPSVKSLLMKQAILKESPPVKGRSGLSIFDEPYAEGGQASNRSNFCVSRCPSGELIINRQQAPVTTATTMTIPVPYE